MTALNRALLAALLASGMTSVAVAKEKPAPAAAPGAVDQKNLSKPGRVALIGVQTLQKSGDQAGALAAVRAARAAGGLNETDRFFLADAEIRAGLALKDDVVTEEGSKELIATPFPTPDQRATILRNLGVYASNRKDYAAATTAYEQYLTLKPDDADSTWNLSIIYSDYKQNDKALATVDRAIAAKKAKGELAPESWYRQRLAISYNNKMTSQLGSASLDMIAAYPKPETWNLVLNFIRENIRDDDQLSLDVFRLMRAAGAIGPEREWQEYAGLALERGLPGEAKSVIDEGISTKKLSGTRPNEKEIASTASAKIAADKASLPGLERDAPKAANGKSALGTGDAYYGYGNYAKAAEMYKLAGSKGGIDAATANLRLGAALAMAGDKAGATTAFQSVTTGPRAQLAQFWLIKVNGKA